MGLVLITVSPQPTARCHWRFSHSSGEFLLLIPAESLVSGILKMETIANESLRGNPREGLLMAHPKGKPCSGLSRWYHGNLTRHAAEALLLSNGRDGSYLLRDSNERMGLYSLSVR